MRNIKTMRENRRAARCWDAVARRRDGAREVRGVGLCHIDSNTTRERPFLCAIEPRYTPTVTSPRTARVSSWAKRRDWDSRWHAHTGTTVVSSSSSPSSPFFLFRFFLNPGKDKISSSGVGTGGRPGERTRPRPTPAAYREGPRPRCSPCPFGS